MSLSTFLSTQIIDDYLRTGTVYLALFTVIPDRDGTGGTEVVGGSYARQAITFGADADGVTTNTNVMVFPGMPNVTVVGGGVYDAVSGGNLLTLGYFSVSRYVNAGADLSVVAGDVVVVIR